MLPPQIRVARAIKKRRNLLKLSQRRIAAAVGCSQSYLAQVETGVRPVSKQVAEKLELFLRVKVGSYTRGVQFRRGRPALCEQTRRVLRELRRARGKGLILRDPLGIPRHPRPDRAQGLVDPLWPIGVHLGGAAAKEVAQLEKLRGAQDPFWRHLQSIRYDSWPEKRLHVQVGLAGAALIGVRMANVGCRLFSLDGQRGRDTVRRAYPAFVWKAGELAVALFPQRCVASRVTHRWPDNVLVAAYKGRRITGVVEVDGKKFHQDPDKEQWRDEDLGVPVLHLKAAELGRPGVVDKLMDWARELLTQE